MAKIYQSTEDLIGNTPLIQVSNIKKELGFQAEILAKLEYLNPAGQCERPGCPGNDPGCRRTWDPRRRICDH